MRFLFELNYDRQLAVAQPTRTSSSASTGSRTSSTRRPARRLAPGAEFDGTVAYFSAEFGVHTSLPGYSGGLGVLAGDVLKEASDRGLADGRRRALLPPRLLRPAARPDRARSRSTGSTTTRPSCRWRSSTATTASRCSSRSTLFGREIAFQVWCVQVGSVSLLLLDAELPENDPVSRWTTARTYDGNPHIRLAQYGLLGIGGARVLEALGIQPDVVHLNEGHPALAALERVARARRGGDAARRGARAGAQARRLHDAHAAPGRQRELPAGAVPGGVRRARRPARHLRRGVPRPLPRRPRARASPACRSSRCACRAGATASAAGTASSRARCGSRCSRSAGRADRPRHERRAPRDLPRRSDVRPARAAPRRALAAEPGRPARRGRPCGTSRTTSCGARAPRRGAGSPSSRSRRPSRTGCCAARRSTTSAPGADLLDADTLTFGFARRLAGYKRLSLLVADARARASRC